MTTTQRSYWPLEFTGAERGMRMELRTALAWELVHHFGAIAGTHVGAEGSMEDGAGRAVMLLQTPDALVARCFEIADKFIETAEQRDGIRGYNVTEEDVFERTGELSKIRSQAEFPISSMPKAERSVEEIEMKARHRQELADLRAAEQKKV